VTALRLVLFKLYLVVSAATQTQTAEKREHDTTLKKQVKKLKLKEEENKVKNN